MTKQNYQLKIKKEGNLNYYSLDGLLKEMKERITVRFSLMEHSVHNKSYDIEINGNDISINRVSKRNNSFNIKITPIIEDTHIVLNVYTNYEERAKIYTEALKDLLKNKLFQKLRDESFNIKINIMTEEYGIFLIENSNHIEDEESYDLRYLEEYGIILNRTLRQNVNIEDIGFISIGDIKALYKENDTFAEKQLKKWIEYATYDIVDESIVTSLKETFPKIKIIKILTLEEYIDFCNDLAKTDKALDSDVCKHIMEYITLPYEDIKNKEIKILSLYKRLENLNDNLEDINGYEIIRILNRIIVEEEKGFFQKRKEYRYPSEDILTPRDNININHVLRLLSLEDRLYPYVNTYKDTFIFYKTYLNNPLVSNFINRILRKGKKVTKVNSTVKYDLDLLKGHSIGNVPGLEDLNLKRLFKLLYIISKNSYYAGADMKDYHIRNGKVFIDKEFKNKRTYLFVTPVMNEIKRRLDKIGKIILPEEYMSPISFSDKKRIGDLYYGSAIKIGYNYSVGIKWDNPIDLDISVQLEDGSVLNYLTEERQTFDKTYYSGDCRNAGSEYIKFIDKDMETSTSGILRVNLFSYKFLKSLGESYVYRIFILDDKDNVIFETENIPIYKNQSSIAIVKNGYCYIDIRGENDRDTVIDNEHNRDVLKLYINKPEILLENILTYLDIPFEKVKKTELREDERYFDINKY